MPPLRQAAAKADIAEWTLGASPRRLSGLAGGGRIPMQNSDSPTTVEEFAMKLQLPPMITLHAAVLLATAAVGAAGTLLCAACGGDGDVAAEPFAQVVTLEVDHLGSADAIVREAAASRGAPGDAESVLYLVRAASLRDAEAAAAQLLQRGFETVRIAAPMHRAQRVAR